METLLFLAGLMVGCSFGSCLVFWGLANAFKGKLDDIRRSDD
jgi:hypothetical protein